MSNKIVFYERNLAACDLYTSSWQLHKQLPSHRGLCQHAYSRRRSGAATPAMIYDGSRDDSTVPSPAFKGPLFCWEIPPRNGDLFVLRVADISQFEIPNFQKWRNGRWDLPRAPRFGTMRTRGQAIVLVRWPVEASGTPGL